MQKKYIYMFWNFYIYNKIFKRMQELPYLHRNCFSGAIIWGSVPPPEENILLLNNIDMYNYTAVGLLATRITL